MLFEWALHANLPIIGVVTDDLVNVGAALQLIADEPVILWGPDNKIMLGKHRLLWTTHSEMIDDAVYRRCTAESRQIIVVNFDTDNKLIFDAGTLPTPPKLIENFLRTLVFDDGLPRFMECLKGLTLKSAVEAVLITEARTGSLTVPELRKTRSMLSGGLQGLSLLDTSFDFYVPEPDIEAWLKTNTEYFINPVHPKLTPRGLLLAGLPGVGKTMAARDIANRFNVPLYHLDVSSVLTKYVGDSEKRLGRILALLDREEPAVVLLDEIEKLFNEKEDAGVTQRLLSQLLWWLQEHQSKIFTVMTTNHADDIPRELYRPGRVDQVITIPPLNGKEKATDFAMQVYRSVMGSLPPKTRRAVLEKEVEKAGIRPEELPVFPHALVTQAVYRCIKENRWLTAKKEPLPT